MPIHQKIKDLARTAIPSSSAVEGMVDDANNAYSIGSGLYGLKDHRRSLKTGRFEAKDHTGDKPFKKLYS